MNKHSPIQEISTFNLNDHTRFRLNGINEIKNCFNSEIQEKNNK